MKPEELNLTLRIAKYGFYNKIFTIQELMDKGIIPFIYDKDKKKVYPELTYVIMTLFQSSMHDKPDSPNVIGVMIEKGADVYQHKYTLAPSVYFSFLDYLEVTEARKAASSARLYSIIGIFIAALSLIFQIFK